MDITIIDQEENPMLHRTDVRFEVVHDEATPSRLSVRDSLAAQLDKASEEVVVHELDTRFGMRKTAGYAKVYESAGDARDVEQEYMLERNKISADGEALAAPDDEGGDEPAEAGVADEADEDESAGEGASEEPAAEEEAEGEAAEAEDEEPPADEDEDAAEADDADEDEEAAAEEEA